MTAPLPLQLVALKDTSPRKAAVIILSATVLILVLLLILIYGPGRVSGAPAWMSWLPGLNALLNGTSAVFLVSAYRAIRRADVVTHSRRILAAMAASALFLVSYIAYHSVQGDTKFAGHGLIRGVYFVILITHIVLSGVALPLIFLSLFFSLSGRFAKHKKIARYTLPVWLYVSVTGVLVFVLLRAYALG